MTTYFDITDILTHALLHNTVTGIQRGVIRIIGALVDDGHDIAGIVKHPTTGVFRAVDLSFLANSYNFSAGDFVSRFEIPSGKSLWLASKLQKYRHRLFKKFVQSVVCHVRWLISPALRSRWGSKMPASNKSCLMELAVSPGDTIVTLGAGWSTDYVGIHSFAKLSNCRVVTFVHDIIPLTHSHFTNQCTNDRFETWIRYCVRHSDLLICNSQYSRRTLAGQLAEWNMSRRITVAEYPQEFVSVSEAGAVPTGNYVLCVGTITQRKNIGGLLQAWQHVVEELGDAAPTLVLAGGADNFVVPDIPKVMFVDSPDDATLESLYHGCMFTVFPSFVEGWGLPVGESLWLGKPVLCARATSIPEVGGKHADYFDPADPDGIYTGLLQLIRRPRTLPASLRNELRRWSDTARTLHAELRRLDSTRKPAKAPAIAASRVRKSAHRPVPAQ